MMVGNSRKNSRQRSSSTVFSWPESLWLLVLWDGQGKWRVGIFAEFKIFSAIWRRPGVTSLLKTSNPCSLSGRSI
jgi:hypothetical protein